ncbi:MAG: AtpZ/AtpI family protein [Alkaliphilus sp.]|nr:AtpZ/AtpI family protein [Alkaliphilus sp.]
MPKKTDEDRKGLENFALITQVGMSMVIPILLGVYIGKKLDDWLNKSPLFLLIFIVIGVAAAFTNLFKVIEKTSGDKKGK